MKTFRFLSTLFFSMLLFQYCTTELIDEDKSGLAKNVENRTQLSQILLDYGFYNPHYLSQNGQPDLNNVVKSNVISNPGSLISIIPVVDNDQVNDIITVIENGITYRVSSLKEMGIEVESSFLKEYALHQAQNNSNVNNNLAIINLEGEMFTEDEWVGVPPKIRTVSLV